MPMSDTLRLLPHSRLGVPTANALVPTSNKCSEHNDREIGGAMTESNV